MCCALISYENLYIFVTLLGWELRVGDFQENLDLFFIFCKIVKTKVLCSQIFEN